MRSRRENIIISFLKIVYKIFEKSVVILLVKFDESEKASSFDILTTRITLVANKSTSSSKTLF